MVRNLALCGFSLLASIALAVPGRCAQINPTDPRISCGQHNHGGPSYWHAYCEGEVVLTSAATQFDRVECKIGTIVVMVEYRGDMGYWEDEQGWRHYAYAKCGDINHVMGTTCKQSNQSAMVTDIAYENGTDVLVSGSISWTAGP